MTAELEAVFSQMRSTLAERKGPIAHEIHVDPSGRDEGPGTQGQPLETLAAAQRRAREVAARISKGELPELPVHVLIHPGIFRLAEPMVFDERDSGQVDRPTRYRAVRPGTVRISGAVPLHPDGRRGNALVFSLPSGVSADWQFAPQLFVNGERAVLARTPNAGSYWFVQPPNEEGLQNPGSLPLDDKAMAWLAKVPETDLKRAIVNLFHVWTTSRLRIANRQQEAIQLTPAPRWPMLASGRSQRLFIENIPAGLDAPGEWIGSGRQVYYIPRSTETTSTPLEVSLTTLPTLWVVRRSSAQAPRVHDLQFSGLDFEYSAFATPAQGYLDNQAASTVGATIEVSDADRVEFDLCSIGRSGNHAIWFRQGVTQSRLTRSYLFDLGAGGIRIGAIEHAGDPAWISSGNLIENNIIADIGHVLPGGVGIWVGPSWDNHVVHNLIYGTRYSGISVGWRWGFGKATSGRNIVEGNLLANIGQHELSDMGGIYLLGEAPGTRILNNLIREVRAYPEYGPGGRRGAWGIYEDEGSSDTQVFGNVVVGTDSGGYHLHYGRNNQVRRNLFAGGLDGEFRVTKETPGVVGVMASDNYLVTAADSPLAALAGRPGVQWEGNMIAAPKADTAELDRRCGTGCTRVKAQVDAGQLLKDIRISASGPGPTFDWKGTVNGAGPSGLPLSKFALQAPELGQIALAPRQSAPLDFGSTPPGGRPRGLNYRPQGDKEAFRVERRGSTESEMRTCLALNDSSSFAKRYEPFFFLQPGHQKGPWRVSFVVWTDGKADLIHEWRDNMTPYSTGPSLSISGTSIRVGGQEVARIAANTWTTLTVESDPSKDHTWSLEVNEGPGTAATRVSNLPFKDQTWREVQWLGFISNAASQTSTCLASLRVFP